MSSFPPEQHLAITSNSIQIALVGDIILDTDEPSRLFDASRAALKRANVVVGQVEVPHSRRGVQRHFDIPAPPSDPARLRALADTNMTVATLVGNHIFDQGRVGIENTLEVLQAQQILTTGAGLNRAEAKRPQSWNGMASLSEC